MKQTLTSKDGTNPQTVECKGCGHSWIGFYLPQPISIAVRLMKSLTCPKCGADSRKIMIFAGSKT